MTADQLAEIALRLANGTEVRLVDLSRGGARVETGRRMLPNANVAVRLVTGDGSFLATGVVVRSRVIRLADGALGYDVALAFNETIQQLPLLPDARQLAAAPVAAPGQPAAECQDSLIHVTAAVPHSAEELIKLFDEGSR